MLREMQLENVDLADLQQLVDDSVQEGKEIEYKEYLDLDSQKHKEQLLGEVTSFANARGGDLFVGVPDDEGTPEKVPGFPVDNVDQTVERWANTIRRGADPKLPPSLFDIKAIHVEDDRHVVIVRVNKSWNPPHRVRATDKFYGRGPSGKFDLDTAEIRRRILETEAFAEKLDDFRDEQISEYTTGETPLPVVTGAKLLCHLVPASAFAPGEQIDRKTAGVMFKHRPRMLGRQSVTGGFSDNYTVDSVIVHQGIPEEGLSEYVRTFSNGTIEMYSAWPFRGEQGRTVLQVDWLEDALRYTLPHQLHYLQTQDIDPPIYACLTMLALEDCVVGVQGLARRHQFTLDPVVQLPAVLIETYTANMDNIVDDLIEYVYNAGGLPGPNSTVYD